MFCIRQETYLGTQNIRWWATSTVCICWYFQCMHQLMDSFDLQHSEQAIDLFLFFSLSFSLTHSLSAIPYFFLKCQQKVWNKQLPRKCYLIMIEYNSESYEEDTLNFNKSRLLRLRLKVTWAYSFYLFPCPSLSSFNICLSPFFSKAENLSDFIYYLCCSSCHYWVKAVSRLCT